MSTQCATAQAQDNVRVGTQDVRLKSSKIQLKKEENGRLVRHARANSAVGAHTKLGMTNNFLTPQPNARCAAYKPDGLSHCGTGGPLPSDLKNVKIKETKSTFESQRNRTNDMASRPYGAHRSKVLQIFHRKNHSLNGEQAEASSQHTPAYYTTDKSPYEHGGHRSNVFITPASLYKR